jgi:hypothetical protein
MTAMSYSFPTMGDCTRHRFEAIAVTGVTWCALLAIDSTQE